MYKKKIREIVIGSNNKGKIKEIKDLLPKYNSLIKAKYFSTKTNRPCLADDSGLEIDILDKRPGIYSARWGGEKGDFNLAIKKVFKALNVKDKNWMEKK